MLVIGAGMQIGHRATHIGRRTWLKWGLRLLNDRECKSHPVHVKQIHAEKCGPRHGHMHKLFPRVGEAFIQLDTTVGMIQTPQLRYRIETTTPQDGGVRLVGRYQMHEW